jgi:Farnesoic acid 0-methyl transferase
LLAAPTDGILGRMRWRVGLGFVLLGAWGNLACRAKDPPINEPFLDNFQRAELGPTWNNTGADYRISDGRLTVKNAYNHPAWLRRKLPPDAVIDVDVVSRSAAGDLKVELYGDGESSAVDRGAYDSTGYVMIFGGWHNSLSVICRNSEHDQGRKAQRADIRVQAGRTYHWTIVRQGGLLDWKLDGQPFLSWTDPEPLGGAGHEYLGVNDWEADVSFDNLSIRPAGS